MKKEEEYILNDILIHLTFILEDQEERILKLEKEIKRLKISLAYKEDKYTYNNEVY